MPRPIVFIAALLLSLPAFAQTRMPARQVEVDTNMVNIAVTLPFTAQAALDWIDANWPALSSESWSNLDPAEDTVQSVFDWVDANWEPDLVTTNWLFLDPAEDTAQSAFDWIDSSWGPALSNLPPDLTDVVVSNAAIMSYNASAHNWNFTNLVVDVFLSLLGNTNDPYRLISDAEAFRSNYLAGLALAVTEAAVPTGHTFSYEAPLAALFSNHFDRVVVPYSELSIYTGIGSLRDEIRSILAELGLESYVAYTWVAGSYGTWPSYETPEGIQTYVIPTNFSPGAVIEVNAWGGGSPSPSELDGAGGYSYGELVVVAPTNFVSTNASHVTNGMVLAVQVGSVMQRSAVWRHGNYTDFHTMTNEILVAGGAGSPHNGASGVGGGAGGGENGAPGKDVPGFGGGQTGGGAASPTYNNFSAAGVPYSPAETGAGRRMWGARYGYRYEASPGEGQPAGYYPANAAGGDGYFGGGAGGWSGWDSRGDGGGGSGFVAASLTNGATTTGGTSAGPGGQDQKSYNGFAGKAGNGGRITFVVPFSGLDSAE